MFRAAPAPGDTDIARAHHEAGHAVIATILGLPVRSVRIARRAWWTGGKGGSTVVHRVRVEQAAEYAAMCYAGGHAQSGWYEVVGIDRCPRADGQTASDDAEADRALGLAASEGTAYDVDEVHDWAGALVVEHWDGIVCVADALLERGDLTGRDVARLLDA
jgi:hypothetical protein